LSVT
jgi:carboxypeptidase C (cathepsin A)